MENIRFPSCCGIKLLCNFGHTLTATDTTNYTEAQIITFLNQVDEEDSQTAKMIVLNCTQYKKIGHIMREHGYRRLKKFHYKGHGNNIYILLKLNDSNKIV